MVRDGGSSRDLAALVVPLIGGIAETGDRYEPYRLVDGDRAAVEGVTAFFRDLLAAGRAESTVRSYGMDLLRWFRFVWAAEVPWDRATCAETRDFSRWLQVEGKQPRSHWRYRTPAAEGGREGEPYALPVRAHSETVLLAGRRRTGEGTHPGRGPAAVIFVFCSQPTGAVARVITVVLLDLPGLTGRPRLARAAGHQAGTEAARHLRLGCLSG